MGHRIRKFKKKKNIQANILVHGCIACKRPVPTERVSGRHGRDAARPRHTDTGILHMHMIHACIIHAYIYISRGCDTTVPYVLLASYCLHPRTADANHRSSKLEWCVAYRRNSKRQAGPRSSRIVVSGHHQPYLFCYHYHIRQSFYACIDGRHINQSASTTLNSSSPLNNPSFLFSSFSFYSHHSSF